MIIAYNGLVNHKHKTTSGPNDHSKQQQMASILPTVSVADPVYHHEQRATSMKKLEAIKKRLPLQDAKDTMTFLLYPLPQLCPWKLWFRKLPEPIEGK